MTQLMLHAPGLRSPAPIRRDATFSADGTYRYSLVRDESDDPDEAWCLWCLLNPSTAGKDKEDPTSRKVIGFDRRWHFSRSEIVNPFAYCATDPSDLFDAMARGADVVGPENDEHIIRAARRAHRVVVGWGAINEPSKLRLDVEARLDRVLDLLRQARADVWCLGLTASGRPRHPLMLGYDTASMPFVRFR